jgi:hypothetical protein
MRLISENPEFTWTGTLLILAFAALLGLGVGLVHGARRSGRSSWWTLAVLPGLVLFAGAAIPLAPCFLLGGLAWGVRGRWPRVVGGLAVVGSVVLMTWLVVSEPGPVTFADLVVFETGYVAMAVTVSLASALVWQRRNVPAHRPAADTAALAVRGSSG